MYASNEDEFNRDDGDWVFLRETTPANTILQEAVNLNERMSSSSSSSSSSDSSSSKSDRSESVSSLSSNEQEHDDHIDEQDSHALIEDPVLTSHMSDENNDGSLPGEVNELLSSEVMVQQVNDSETTPVINEYELLNSGCDLSEELVISSHDLRRRTGADVQQTDDPHPSMVEQEHRPLTMPHSPPRRNNTLLVYGLLILLIALPSILCRFSTSQRLVVDQITEKLQKTNQRLDEMKTVSIEDIEQKLTKQLEERFQEMLNQKMLEYNREKYSFVLQINELYHIIHITQQNLTNTIYQLSDENEQLQNQMIALEQRLQRTEEQILKDKEACPDGVDCTKSSASSVEILLGNLLKQTTSIAEDTSINLSGFFEQLSASLSDLVDHRHEYVEESKRKLSDLAASEAAEQVQKTLRRSVDNLSSSLHKAQSTYAAWVRSRAQQREQARTDNTEEVEEKEKSVRRPWRWTFKRGQDREQMRHQTPVTKKHSSNKEYVCHSNYEFPVNKLCSMKNWMEKFFHP